MCGCFPEKPPACWSILHPVLLEHTCRIALLVRLKVMSNQLSISCDREGDGIRMAGWPSRDATPSNNKYTWDFSLKEELGAFRPLCAKVLSPALPTQAKASALDASEVRELYHGSGQWPKKLCIRGEVQDLLQFLDKYKNSIELISCLSWI